MKTREYLRVPLPIPVRIKVVDRDEEFWFTRVDDISWGGAFIVMESPVPMGSRVVLQFSLSDENVSLELWGVVVRVKLPGEGGVPGAGVEFDPLDHDSKNLIQNLVFEEIRALLKIV